MEEQLEEMRRRIEKEKAEREAEKSEREASLQALRASVKKFYPISWKSKKGRDHKHIDSWDLAKLKQMEEDWHKDYTDVRKSNCICINYTLLGSYQHHEQE